jgi:hypothetical protein
VLGHGMADTELMVALNTQGTINLTDFYSVAYQKPTQMTGTPLPITAAVANTSGIFVTFSRALAPTSANDQVLAINMTTDFSYAYLSTANKGFAAHNFQNTGVLTLGNTNSTSKWWPGAVNTPYFPLDDNFYLGWEFGKTTITFIFSVLSI